MPKKSKPKKPKTYSVKLNTITPGYQVPGSFVCNRIDMEGRWIYLICIAHHESVQEFSVTANPRPVKP